MKTVYIDCTGSVPIKGQPFHGGANYTHSLLFELQKREFPGLEFVLLLPFEYTPIDTVEESVYTGGYYKIIHVNSLSDDLKLNENSTLFMPLLYRQEDIRALKNIKQTNPTVKLVATIHDMRHLFNRYGYISRFYYTGLIHYIYFLQKPVWWFNNKFILTPAFKNGFRFVDTIFTDSNYSLQKIMEHGFSGDIIPHYLTPKPRVSNDTTKDNNRYFLFVSGNRVVKNLLRTLTAFCMFKKTDDKDYYLYVTGIDKQMLSNLVRYKKINKEIVEKWVRISGYVTDEELDRLYRNCSALLFTSLAEGFGLPILEAARHGRPSISSYTTSIPEVLGSCTYYVDPYDVKSMLRGMEHMTQEHILKQYEAWLSEYYPVIEQRIKIDLDVLFHHITI